MEYRYKKTCLGPVFILLGGISTIGAIIWTIYDIFIKKYPPTALPMLVNSLMLLLIGIALYKFYRKERHAIIGHGGI